MPSIAVITPTIGTPELVRCVKSLRGQDCSHYLVVDGREHNEKVNRILVNETGVTQQEKMIWLDENVGKGWYGHRVYAAASFLVNEDILCYLDEDNWVEPDYIESFKATLNKFDWAFTLRNIVEPDGAFVCQDNWESLGLWPVVGQNRYHVDTSCFAVPRKIAVQVGHRWYGQWGADRQFFDALRQVAPNFGCTNKYTLNYRLGGPTSKVTKDHFLQGNEIAKQLYQGEYPWVTQTAPKKILKYNTVTGQYL
jgi:hypothetical protein